MRLAVEYDRRVRKLRKAFLRARQPQSPLGGPRSPASARSRAATPATWNTTPTKPPRTRDLLLLAASLCVLLYTIAKRLEVDYHFHPLERPPSPNEGSGVRHVLACTTLQDLQSSLPSTPERVQVALPLELASTFPANLTTHVQPVFIGGKWSAPAALNLAAARCTAMWLMLLPCGCQAPMLPSILQSDTVYTVHHAPPYDPCAHTTLITRHAYLAARGVDERGAIGIDRSLHARAIRRGYKLEHVLNATASLRFDHTVATRIAADQLLQDGVPAWSALDDHNNTAYHVASRHATSYTSWRGTYHPHRTAIPFEVLVAHRGGETPESIRALANATGATNVLHARYRIPHALTVGMTPESVHRLLGALADAENARYQAVLKELRGRPALHHAARDLAGTPPLRARVLAIEPMHGLGNRLRAVASARALARATGRVLLVAWTRDMHCLAGWDALLAADELRDVHVTTVTTRWPPVADQDDAWERWDHHDYMAADQKNAPIMARYSTNHLIVRSAYALRPHPVGDATWAATNDELRALPPSVHVASLVRAAEAAAGTAAVRAAVGVHVRHRSVQGEIQGAQYGANATRLLEYWRSKSAPHHFATEMRCADPSATGVTYVVAADSDAARDAMRAACPRATVLRGCDDRSEQCVLQAYAELLLLARTREILASPWSSFSEVAARIGGVRMRVAGVDFADDDPAVVRKKWGNATASVVMEVQRRRRLKRWKRARQRRR